MAADSGWTSGHTSSSDLAVISILFPVIYIALYTLCSACFSSTSECPEEKEEPSSLSVSVILEDHGSTLSSMNVSSSACCDMPHVPAGPQNHTEVHSQKTPIYSHSRAKSDGYFSQEIPPRISDTSEFSALSRGSVASALPALPPIPPVLYFTSVLQEPENVSSSSSGPQMELDTDVWESLTLPPEDVNNVFSGTHSREHLYECIDHLGPLDTNKPEENEWESESPYSTVTPWTEPADSSVTDSTRAEGIQTVFPSLPTVQDETSNPDTAVLYAEVNKKSKRQKRAEGEASVVRDLAALEEDMVPPVPEKIFN